MLENNIYHIYNRGNNKEIIFFEERNYQFFLQRFRYYFDDLVKVYAYCLMPNHFHVLLKVKKYSEPHSLKSTNNELNPLENAFKRFFMSYSKSINKAYNRTGSLFQKRFQRKIILEENYLRNIIAYIHLNPVRSSLVKAAEQWHYSSYKDFFNDQSIELNIDKKRVIDWFGNKQSFFDFHKLYRDFQKERDFLFNER